MVKPIWIAVAFVAGIGVGVAVVRMTGVVQTSTSTSTPTVTVAKAQSEPRAVAATADVAASPAATLPAAATPALPYTQPAAHAPVTGEPVSAPVAARAAGPASTPAESQNTFPPLAADDGSPVGQPIDVGEPFRENMAKLTVEGDAIADAHRALEREVRDDVWSYQSESSIQSTLIPETAAGNFESHYVECRATLCEVRLSAQNENQAEALRVWADNLNKQPWSSRLYPMYSTSITKDGKTDRLIILRKPRK